MPRSASRMLLRCTSVGCAVSTGLTRAPSHQATIASAPTPPDASAAIAPARSPALRGRTGERVHAPATVLVHVLGDVRELREVRERADDLEHLRGRQSVQHRGERGASRVGLLAVAAPEADRRLTDPLDPRVALLARLLAEHVPEDATEQARVVAQRPVLVGIVRVDRGQVLVGVHRAGSGQSTIAVYMSPAPRPPLRPRAGPPPAHPRPGPPMDPRCPIRCARCRPHARHLDAHRRALRARSAARRSADLDMKRLPRRPLEGTDHARGDDGLCCAHAEEVGLARWIAALFAGEKVNVS